MAIPHAHSLQRMLQHLGVALALSLAWPVPAQTESAASLPQLGDSSDMSPISERHMGDRIARELYRDPDYLDDPVVMEYVDEIWRKLIDASRARGEMPDILYETYAWDILLGRDRSVNAFALPGGYFGLHLGLLAIVTNRDELASVLAHELSHVTQRHISRSMARQNAQTPWVVGSMILGILAAAKSPDGAQAVIVGGQAAAAQSQLNYSRDMEREADRIGFNVLTQAGYAPQGFVSMFQKLQQASRLNDQGSFPYLRTHPLTTERIADMQARTHVDGPVPDPAAAPEHALIAARARVLSYADVDSLRRWARQAQPENMVAQDAAAQRATLYGATLAALTLKDFVLAEATLQSLQSQAQRAPAAQRLTTLLAVELALAQGQPARARALAAGLDTGRRASLLLRAQTEVLGGDAQSAAQMLRNWLVTHPRDAQAWQLLARAYTALGRNVASVRAQAEVSYAQCDYSAAMLRFKAAQDLVRKAGADHIEAEIVDARVRQLQSLLKAQAGEP